MTPPLRGTWRTLDRALAAAAEQFGDREAYVDGQDRLSFAEWAQQAGRVAAGLADAGVRRGDVVLMLLPNGTDYAVSCAALVQLGAVSAGINPRLGPVEMDAVAAGSQAAFVLRDPVLACGQALRRLPTIEVDQLRRFRETPAQAPPAPELQPADLVTIVWTSGTTGLPKGACFDHDALRAAVGSAGVMAAAFDRRLLPTPLAHAGYMTKLWEQLAWGITLVLTPTPWTAEAMLRVLEQERITVCGGVPTQFAKLVERAVSTAADLSSLRLAVVATAPAPPDLVAAIETTLGCPVVVRYAMTECPSITGTEPGDPPHVLLRSVGRPQAGVELQVVGPDGTAVPDGDVGRVRVRSRGAMRGYWQGPADPPAGLSQDGWLTSSDLGRIDPDGNLVLVGRESEMYIRGGYNVHPLEVENVLREHPAVGAAAVVGIPAPVIGEIGVAFVAPAEWSPHPDEAELRAWCRARLADYKTPDRVVVLPVLPVTSMLKTDKAALRQQAAALSRTR